MEVVQTGVTAIQGLTAALSGADWDDISKITREWIRSKGSRENQLKEIEKINDSAEDRVELIGEVITEAWSILKAEQLWRVRWRTEREGLEALDNPRLKAIRSETMRARTRKGAYVKAIKSRWGEETKNWKFGTFGENRLRRIGEAAKVHTFENVKVLMIHVIMDRLRQRRRGQGSRRVILAEDWKTIAELTVEKASTMLIRSLPSIEELNLYEIELDQMTITGVENIPEELVHEDHASTSHSSKRRRYNPVSRETETSRFISDESEDVSSDAESTTTESIVRKSKTARRREARQTSAHRKIRQLKPAQCGCEDVDEDLLARLERDTAFEANMTTEHDCLTVIYELMKGSTRRDLTHVCYRHLYLAGGFLGLKVNAISTSDLRYRLITCWNHRVTLDQIKTGAATHQWFRLRQRPSIPDDELGLYAVRPRYSTLLQPLGLEKAKAIVEEAVGGGAWSRWEDEGNLIVNDLFSWLWDGVTTDAQHESGIGEMIDEEFDMYLHHQRDRNGKPNYGWLRVMFYSLTQQLIRQDIMYWMLYACLRPDRNVRLISYPYYTKYAIEGDNTYFRHIDMNIPRYLADGHGGNIIQGSVSLDDESEKACTMIVPGFHHKILQWWLDVEERLDEPAEAAKAHIHSLDKIWKPADEIKYGKFVPVPCQRGGARITRPEILHGSTKKGSREPRRTILPWFCGIREDGSTLDNEEAENWNQLATFHASQTAPQKSPSGLSNRYGHLPYRFPAATQLILTSPISNALVGRTTWADPAVEAQANVLLGPNRPSARKMVAEHRVLALRAFKKAYEKVEKFERFAYGEAGFFATKDRGALNF